MFHKSLKTFRLQAGMSQVQLAKAVKMNPSHLNRVERGLRKPPKREKVIHLARALGLNNEEKASFLLEAGYSPPEIKKGNSHASIRGYAALLPKESIDQLEAEEESKILPELVRDILSDQTITPLQRREMAMHIRSFVLWLRDSIKTTQVDKKERGKRRKKKSRTHK